MVPAAHVAHLHREDSGLGVDLPDGRRLARCLRCDGWVALPAPTAPAAEQLPSFDQIPLPKRGKALRDVLVLRLIAVDRAVHSLVFGLTAAGALAVATNLPGFRATLRRWLLLLDQAAATSGQGTSNAFVARELRHLVQVQSGSLRVIFVTAGIYCLLEGVEAVGLWRQRRWAEYLTAVATAGFLPFEIIELGKRVTLFRVGALVVNVAILVWLLWKKRLFGLARLRPAGEGDGLDRAALFGPLTQGTPFLPSRPVR